MNSIKKIVKKIDYPAAHSMDSYWFAIDENGEVAHMVTSEEGPVPSVPFDRDGLFGLTDHLKKDENGILFLQIQYDPFPDGFSTRFLEKIREELTDEDRETLKRFSTETDLSWYDPYQARKRPKWAIVQFANAINLKNLFATIKWGETIRVDAMKNIYYFCGPDELYALHLLDQGQILAWHSLEPNDVEGMLEPFGIYEYEGENDQEQYLGEAAFQPKRLPPPYTRRFVPKHPRTGLYSPENASSQVILPGVRFASMTSVQLADSIPCYGWGVGYQNLTNSTVHGNINRIHNRQDPPQKDLIDKWHEAAQQGDPIAQYTLGYLYSFSPDVPTDFARALTWFKKSSEQAESTASDSEDAFENGSAAQCSVGDMYERGIGVAQDFDQAFHWYRKAAEKGNYIGQYRLGLCLKNGTGTKKDLEAACKWLQKSVLRDYEPAKKDLYELDQVLLAEKGVDEKQWLARKLIEDSDRSLIDQLFQSAAGSIMISLKTSHEEIIRQTARYIRRDQLKPKWIANSLCVQFEGSLTQVYLTFSAEEQDHTLIALNKALAPQYELRFARQSDCSNAIAVFLLETEIWKNLETEFGDKVKDKFKKIADDSSFFKEAAASDPATCNDINRKEKQIQEIRRLANNGNITAQYDLAYRYEYGNDIVQDYTQAVEWYLKAAEQTEANPIDSSNMFENGSAAKCNLADKYEHGLGVPQNYLKAIEWYLKSAAQDNCVAQYSLGNLYRNGFGVPKNLTLARTWFEKSAKLGYQDARKSLEELRVENVQD